MKINKDHLLIEGNPVPSLVLIKSRGQKILSRQHTGLESYLNLTSEHVTWKSVGIIYSLRATPAPSLVLIKWRGQKILSWQHSGLKRVGWEEWFDLDLQTCDVKINRDHLLIEGNPCTKFCIDQVKGSKEWADNTWSTDRHTDRPTDRQCPLLQRGHKKQQTRYVCDTQMSPVMANFKNGLGQKEKYLDTRSCHKKCSRAIRKL